MGAFLYALIAAVTVLAMGGAALAFAGGKEIGQKRIAAVVKPRTGAADKSASNDEKRRKNMQAALKNIESKSKKNQRISMSKRLAQAGISTSVRTFWIISGAVGFLIFLICLIAHQTLLIALGAGFAGGFGLPRWVLSFLRKRREKSFTGKFASAIDVIVRGVKTGLPVNEALRIVAREVPDPVGSEFSRLVESMKLGVTLEQGLKKMHDNMPTAEVGFFGIAMTIQQKTGGNLSETLSNLSGILRERKRLQGKIKAMSSEAKASAMIIGSLPPAVAGIVYVTTPSYIALLFTERLGNLLLLVCAIWMSIGIFVMRKMINFKH